MAATPARARSPVSGLARMESRLTPTVSPPAARRATERTKRGPGIAAGPALSSVPCVPLDPLADGEHLGDHGVASPALGLVAAVHVEVDVVAADGAAGVHDHEDADERPVRPRHAHHRA